MSRLALFMLLLVGAPVLAEVPALRPSASLLFKAPELLRPGSCVRYQEGGAGWIAREPEFFLRGEVVSAMLDFRQVGTCPLVPGKSLHQYQRAEFVRYLQALPCVAPGAAPRNQQIGLVRLRVVDWETPHERKAENAGRLWRGHFIDMKLEKGMEIEMEADLLGNCDR